MRRIWMSITLLGMTATLGAADRPAPIVKTVEIHAGGPALEVRIVPTSTDREARLPYTIGRVEISRPGEPRPFQTIEVRGYDGPRNLPFSKFEDVNFDGYTDLLLGNDGGAKWGGYAIYLYDPESGTFVENGLSREMSERLRGNELEFDRVTQEIRVFHLVAGCQENVPVAEAYVLEGDHLRRIRQEDLVRGKDGCYKVTHQILPGGAMKEISRERAPDFDRAE